MDGERDLQTFIAGKRTGHTPPPHIAYEPVPWVGVKQSKAPVQGKPLPVCYDIIF